MYMSVLAPSADLRAVVIDDDALSGALLAAALRPTFSAQTWSQLPTPFQKGFDWRAHLYVVDDRLGILTANDTFPHLRRAIARSARIIAVSAGLLPARRARLLELGADAAFSKDEIDDLRAYVATTVLEGRASVNS